MIEIHNLIASRYRGTLDIPYLVLPNVGIVGLKGLEYSGKTTLLKCLANITEYRGKIIIDDAFPLNKYSSNFVYEDLAQFRHYEADNFNKALSNVAAVYGLNDIETIKERSKTYLRHFDLTENDSYEDLPNSRRILFSLAIVLSLDLPVLLLDNLFDNIENDYYNTVIEVLIEFARKHLLVVSISEDIEEISFTRLIGLNDGTIEFDKSEKQEDFKSLEFKKDRHLSLSIFGILPHLTTRAKIFITVLSVIFTLLITSLSSSFVGNLDALIEYRNNTFTTISKTYDSSDVYVDYDNALLTISSDTSSATSFKIRPLVDSESDEMIINLSEQVSSLLDVKTDDYVSILNLDFKVNKVVTSSTKDVYLPYDYYVLLAPTNDNYFYHLRSYDNCTYYSASHEVEDKKDGVYYYNINTPTNLITHDNFGFYESQEAPISLVIYDSDDLSSLYKSKDNHHYVINYSSRADLYEYAERENNDFLYNRMTVDSSVFTWTILSIFFFLLFILTIFLKADKFDSDYYKFMSKQKYVLLQAFKFASFITIVLLSSLLFTLSIARESIILLFSLSILGGTIVAFFILYLLLGRFVIKDR